MTRVVISQPMYFPWPGFIAQLAMADVLIWLDDAQFSKGSFTNRVQVLLNGTSRWMTVPLQSGGSFKPIRDLAARTPDWSVSHRGLLHQSLADKDLSKTALSLFDEVTAPAQDQSLCTTLIASCDRLATYLGVLPPTVLISSDMQVPGQSSERVLDLVKAVDGTRYLTGHGAARYLDHALFERQGVDVEYMDYAVGTWPQTATDFTPYVTTLDLIASLPLDQAQHCLNPRSKPWREFLK